MRSTVRKSKLDAYAEFIGSLPDKDVAQKAGVTPENVRTFRLRRGIPASWRGESAEELAVRVQSKAKLRKPSTSPRSSRPSKLDPFRQYLGELADKEVAEMAGVSAENVRSYRLRRGIPAGWRGEASLPIHYAGTGKVPLRALSIDPSADKQAFRVIAEVAGRPREYVTFGADMSEAAEGARERLVRLHPEAVLREIRLIGSAL